MKLIYYSLGIFFSCGTCLAQDTLEMGSPQLGSPIAAASAVSLGSPITILGHYDNSLGSSDAASQGVIYSKTLEDQPFLRPGEVLETVPGLVVTQHSGEGKANQYFLRGYNLDHGTDFTTSIDGVQTNMPTHAHGQGYSDLNDLIPELIDHIDYRKGPYFAENGDFASAGSAEVIYKKDLKQNFSSFTLGSYGYQRALVAGSTRLQSAFTNGVDTSLIDTRPKLLGALEIMHEDGPWQIKEKLQKVNGLVRLSEGNNSKGWSFDFRYYTAHWNSTDQIPLELVQSGQLGLYDTMNSSDGGQSQRTTFALERHEVSDEGYQKLQATVEHHELNLWSDFTFYEFRPQTGDQFEQLDQRNTLSIKWVKGWNGSLLGNDSTAELGGNLRFDRIHLGLFNTQFRKPLGTVSHENVDELMQSIWAQNHTTWAPWLRTITGVRADHVNMDMTAFENPQNSGLAQAGKISPKFSSVFGPWYKTEFFFNIGKGLHSNDARGVINKIDPTTNGLASQIQALSGSFGQEFGARSQPLANFETSLAIWKLKSDSELVYSADSAIGNTTANGASMRTGIEWNNHYTLNDWLLLDADFAWTHSNYVSMNDNGQVGNQVPNAVGKVGILRAALHHMGPWSIGLENRYIGSYPLTQDGSQVAPAALISNLKIKRELDMNTTLSVDALNLFNRQYYDIAYNQDYRISPQANVQPNGITIHPGEPRQVRLNLVINY